MSNKLEIIDVWSSDIEDIANWMPANTYAVYFQLYLAIAEENTDNEYEFQVEIGTPLGLQAWSEKNEIQLISDRNLIVVKDYSFNIVIDRINEILYKCKADSWNESVTKLQRYFLWEYEDFK